MAAHRRGSQRFEAPKVFDMLLKLGRWRGPYGKESGRPVGGESSPPLAAIKERGPEVLQPCGTESCQQPA